MTIDVAIVGGGPVGLTLANLLGRRGVSVVVFEKQARPYPLPRAIHFDGEAMRCFQAAGLAEAILPHTHIGKGMLFKSPGGETLVDWSRAQEIGPMGWYESYRFYQPGLEAVLRSGLARFDTLTLRTGAEVVDLQDRGDRAEVVLASGERVSARFGVACDGAGSPTREKLGITLEDLGFRERWLVVDAKLSRPRPDLGDHSIQFCDPENPTTYVRGVGPWRRWEMRLRPEDPETMPEQEIWARLARWITPSDGTVERGAIYTFRSRIARQWRVGRVLLAGDAVHQMPPFMGQGMCAGLRDAANLWWKLLAVLNGYDSGLLETYQTEREKNARAFIERSIALGRLINQTARGEIPTGKMVSIWPDLGPGLGPRDGVGGALAPQSRARDGVLSDDTVGHQFHVHGTAIAGLPSVPKLDQSVVVRPDGYVLGPTAPPFVALARSLNACLVSRCALN